MKNLILILMTLFPFFGKTQEMIIDLRDAKLYKNSSRHLIIKTLPVGSKVEVLDKPVGLYYKAKVDGDTGYVLKHTLIDTGSVIQPINVELLYQNLFQIHPKLEPIQQRQEVGFVDHRNYGIRLRINNDVKSSVEDIINTRKMKMQDALKTSDKKGKDKVLITEYISKAYADTRVEHEKTAIEIWERYAERPKFKPFPSRNAATSMMYFKQSKKINFLSNVNVEGWDSLGSIKSNIFTGFVSPVQISVNTMISRITPDRLEESTINTLSNEQLKQELEKVDSANTVRSTLYKTISGGGEVSIALRYPILAYNTANSLHEASATIEVANYLGLDLPLAGRYIAQKDLILNNVFQIQPTILIPFKTFSADGVGVSNTDEKFNGFSIRGSLNLVHGSKKFYEALEIEQKPFSYKSLSLALIIDPFTIQYTLMNFSNDKFNNSNYNRLQVLINTNLGK